MTSITEIGPDLYRISTRAPGIDLQYNETRALRDLARVLRETLGGPTSGS